MIKLILSQKELLGNGENKGVGYIFPGDIYIYILYIIYIYIYIYV